MRALRTLWRVQAAIVALASLAVLALASGSAHSSEMAGKIEFRSEFAPRSTLRISLGQWSEPERRKVLALLGDLQEKAPGLLARAVQAGPIMLYRTGDDSPSHPSAAWARRRHENSLIFRGDFFRPGRPNHLGVDYASWLFVHEIAHLADPVDRIGQSPEWSALVTPRIEALKKELARSGLTVRKAMFKRLDKPAMARGFPSVYAAISQHEALAEFAAAHFFETPFQVPGEVSRFLDARLFSQPASGEGDATSLYRKAHLLYRMKQYDGASAALTAALEQDSGFGMGLYLRGFVYLHAGRLPQAEADWTKALSLVPRSDRRITAELLQGRAFARSRLKNWRGAETDYTMLLELNPRQGGYYLMRGRARLNLGRPAEAVADLGKAVKLSPRNRKDAEKLLAIARSRLKESN